MWLIDLNLNLISIILINNKHFKNVCYVAFALSILCFCFCTFFIRTERKAMHRRKLGKSMYWIINKYPLLWDYGLRIGYIGKGIWLNFYQIQSVQYDFWRLIRYHSQLCSQRIHKMYILGMKDVFPPSFSFICRHKPENAFNSFLFDPFT